MKKSVISKIILALVLVALIFSFAACGKKNDSGSNNTTTAATSLKTPELQVSGGTVTWGTVKGAGTYEYVITHADGTTTEGSTKDKKVIISEGDSIVVRAVPTDTKSYQASEWSASKPYEATIQDQLISLVEGISGITDTITAVQAGDKLSADLSIGGYVRSASSDLDNSIALALKANASKNDPEFMIDFKLNGKAYVSLGYKDAKVYVREPINFINTDEKDANAFVIDVKALEPTVIVLMGEVMDLLGKAEIDLSVVTGAVKGILNGFEMDLSTLIDLKEENNTVSLGIKIGLLSTGINMLKTMSLDVNIPSMVDQYIGYANKALTAVGMDELTLNGRPLTWATIESVVNAASTAVDTAKEAANRIKDEAAKNAALAAIKESLIKIVVGYNNKVMNSISLVADLSILGIQNVDYEAGLTIGLPTFAKNGNVEISTSGFTAQDIVIDLSGALPIKELSANVQGVVRLSDGLANKNNKWATVKATGNQQYDATGYINANGAYVDFGGIYSLLGVTGQPAKFKYEFEKNLIDDLNEFVADFFADTAANTAPRSWEEYEFDLDAIINGFSAAADKVDYVCGYVYNNFVTIIDATVDEKANAGQADLISWAFNYKLGDTNTAAKDYVLFYNNAASFEAIWENIKACHNNGKVALEVAASSEGKVAGIQLTKLGENNDLLDYLSYFVLIPTIGDNEEFDFDNRVAPNNTDALIDWLNWIFPTTNEYRKLVDDILGIGLDGIIEQGLYLEAIGGTGLAGTVRAASDDTNEAVGYISLGGAIDIKAGADTVNDITGDDFVSFDQKNAETDKYYIYEAGLAMRDALAAYGKAE